MYEAAARERRHSTTRTHNPYLRPASVSVHAILQPFRGTYAITKPKILGQAIGIPRYRIFDFAVDHDERAMHISQIRTMPGCERQTESTEIVYNSRNLADCQKRRCPVRRTVVKNCSLSGISSTGTMPGKRLLPLRNAGLHTQ